MVIINKLIFLTIIILLSMSCEEKISYSGKLLKEEVFDYNNFDTKQDIINSLGYPSYIDPIEQKFYYFTERRINKNFYENKLDDRKLIVFNFNIDNSIHSINEYDLSDQKKTKIIKDSISNNLLKQGLLENIFGGVGKNKIQTTP